MENLNMLERLCLANYEHINVIRRIVIYWKIATEMVLENSVKPNEAIELIIKELDQFVFSGIFTPSSTVCRKMFKVNEFIFNCEDCSMDYTCVLCIDCFVQSEHRFHSYRIRTSSGGGCCDCGDPDAWNNHNFCSTHRREQEEKLDISSLKATVAILAVIQFVQIWVRNDIEDLEPEPDSPNNYYVILNKIHPDKLVVKNVVCSGPCEFQKWHYKTECEGRWPIYCNTFNNCQAFTNCISGIESQWVKVTIRLKDAVGCEELGIELLQWLRKSLHISRVRELFLGILTAFPNILDFVFRDRIWRSVQLEWHRIFLTFIHMEYDHKKTVAKILLKNYSKARTLVESFTYGKYFTLFVQLFTIPRLAYDLMANENVLSIVLQTLLENFVRYVFNYNSSTFSDDAQRKFHETLDIFDDLKYLLSSIPTDWNRDLEESFFRGFKIFLDLLTLIQGARSFTDDETLDNQQIIISGILFQRKLAICTSLIIAWCGSKREILIKSYKLVFSYLTSLRRDNKYFSYHLPLTRLFAALYFHLEKYDLHLHDLFKVSEQRLVKIIDPILDYHVLIAEQNKYNRHTDPQIHFETYHLRNYKGEMWDRDINLLQITATLIDSEKCISYIYGKFVSAEDLEGRKILCPFAINHLLFLLINIIGERYMPGISNITQKDQLRNEIVQHLFLKPLSHSELLEKIADDLTCKKYFNSLLLEVADVTTDTRNPERKIYNLRKLYYDECNVYFHHYSQVQYEVAKRTLILRRTKAGELRCCPPPKLLKLNNAFIKLVNLLKSNEFLKIIQDCLQASLTSNSNEITVRVLEKALFLIGYGLQEEQSNHYEGFNFIEKANQYRLFSMLNQLVNCPQAARNKELIQWTISKYEDVTSSKTADSSGSTRKTTLKRKAEIEREMHTTIKKFFSSKSGVLTREPTRTEKKIDTVVVTPNQTFSSTRKIAVAKRKANQESTEINFIVSKVLAEMLKSKRTKLEATKTVALGPNQTLKSFADDIYRCIICRRMEKVTSESTLFSLGFLRESGIFQRAYRRSIRSDDNTAAAFHLDICGHVIHKMCFFNRGYGQRDTMKKRCHDIHVLEVIERTSFSCPVCNSDSNIFIPLVPPLNSLNQPVNETKMTWDKWIETLTTGVRVVDIEGSNKDFTVSSENIALLNYIKFNLNITVYSEKMSIPMWWKTLVCTLRCTSEVLLRDPDKSLLGHLSEKQKNSLESLVRVGGLLSLITSEKEFKYIDKWFKSIFSNDDCDSILQLDPLEALITLTFSMYYFYNTFSISYFPSGNQLDLHILQLLFTANIIKILVLMDVNEVKSGTSGAYPQDNIADILKMIPGKYEEGICTKMVWNYIQEASLDFLRCSVLFYHFLTDVPAPSNLLQPNGGTFANMCSYLSLPQTPTELFASKQVIELIKYWCKHPSLPLKLLRAPIPMALQNNSLIPLPNTYLELLDKYSKSSACEFSRETQVLGGMYLCLICGDVICGRTCLRKCVNGFYSSHLEKCTSIGLFLRLTSCELVYISQSHKEYIDDTPYLNEYGENDRYFKNCLTLCSRLYKEIETMWLNHEIQEKLLKDDREFAEDEEDFV